MKGHCSCLTTSICAPIYAVRFREMKMCSPSSNLFTEKSVLMMIQWKSRQRSREKRFSTASSLCLENFKLDESIIINNKRRVNHWIIKDRFSFVFDIENAVKRWKLKNNFFFLNDLFEKLFGAGTSWHWDKINCPLDLFRLLIDHH